VFRVSAAEDQAAVEKVHAGDTSAFECIVAPIRIFQGWHTVGASWIALALALSLASVKLAMRFASGKM
jgi:hypothetical protein